jgi:hypothetical protein
VLLPDLVISEVSRGWYFGKGLAAGATDLSAIWQRLASALAAATERERSVDVHRGFLRGAAEQDVALTARFLDEAIGDPILGPWFPALQAVVEIVERGVERLEAARQAGLAPLWTYRYLSNGCAIASIPTSNLRCLLLAFASEPDGFDVATDLLSMRLHCDRRSAIPLDYELVQCGRELLRRWSVEGRDHHLDYNLGEIVNACFEGIDAESDASVVCHHLAEAFSGDYTYVRDYPHLLASLLRTQPMIALDAFFGERPAKYDLGVIWRYRLHRENPVDNVPVETLVTWAQLDPSFRFPRLALVITHFTEGDGTTAPIWTPTALEILRRAPDRVAVLRSYSLYFEPTSWSGSVAAILERRRILVREFLSDANPQIVAWAQEQDTRLDRLAQQERLSERREDERFE